MYVRRTPISLTKKSYSVTAKKTLFIYSKTRFIRKDRIMSGQDYGNYGNYDSSPKWSVGLNNYDNQEDLKKKPLNTEQALSANSVWYGAYNQ